MNGLSDAVGFVLAGGQSSRMGEDKALVQFAGQTLAACALRILRDAGIESAIAGAHSDLSAYAPVIPDRWPGQGPLSGICAALSSTPSQWAVFIPVDLPLLPSSLIRYLIRHAQITGSLVTLVSVNGFPQTLPAVIHRDARSNLHEELEAGRLGCFAAFRTAASLQRQSMSVLPVELLVQSGQVQDQRGIPVARWFSNFNSPRDVERACCYRVS